MVMRGEVWIARLDPTVGDEIQKTRPVLIVSPDALNRSLRTVIVVPMTTGSRSAPFRVETEFGGKTGLLKLEQLRAVDRRRLLKRVGQIDEKTLAMTLVLLTEMFTE